MGPINSTGSSCTAISVVLVNLHFHKLFYLNPFCPYRKHDVIPRRVVLKGRKPHCVKFIVTILSGNNPLMRQLYEVDTPPDDLSVSISPTCPALWRYRTQVTLDHLSHTFQHEVASTDPERNKVLAEFLRQVSAS